MVQPPGMFSKESIHSIYVAQITNIMTGNEHDPLHRTVN
jgi:hypothetical protein